MSDHSCASRRDLKADELLKKSGLKVTDTRVLLLELLHAGHSPQSAEDLFAATKKKAKALRSKKIADLVTIYRNLKSFLDADLIQATELGTGRKLYEWLDQSHHHHHIVCKSCGHVEVLEICGLDQHFKTLRNLGYEDIGHRLEFFGTCADCQKKKSVAPKPPALPKGRL